MVDQEVVEELEADASMFVQTAQGWSATARRSH
jgi:hypothetical protein